MKVKDLLMKVDFGDLLADDDRDLQNYFVETSTFHALLRDDGDIVTGDKGTGKSAMYRALIDWSDRLFATQRISIIDGSDPVEYAAFQTIAEDKSFTPNQYIELWKGSVLSLIGNEVLLSYEDDSSESLAEFGELLEAANLRVNSRDQVSPSSTLTKVFESLRHLKHISLGLSVSLTPEGMTTLSPKIDFATKGEESVAPTMPSYDEMLVVLDDVLGELGVRVWLVIDRLDEAFEGFPEIEMLVLRALLRTYLQLRKFPNFRLKLFIKKDLFARVVNDGFVALSHVNARRIDIEWEDDDLFDLLHKRIRANKDLVQDLGLEYASKDELFTSVFPSSISSGGKRTTWSWILSHLQDGNGVKAPRNVIDLAIRSRTFQLKQEDREPREYQAGTPLIGQEEIKKAYKELSKRRVEDALLAEAGGDRLHIRRFRNSKAQHSEASLATILGVSGQGLMDIVERLKLLGFLEEEGSTYTIPPLYREGLSIKQGTARG